MADIVDTINKIIDTLDQDMLEVKKQTAELQQLRAEVERKKAELESQRIMFGLMINDEHFTGPQILICRWIISNPKQPGEAQDAWYQRCLASHPHTARDKFLSNVTMCKLLC
jgi:hypothetical protein